MSYFVKLLPTTPNAASFYTDRLMGAGEENAGFDLFVPQTIVFAADERKFVSMEVKAVVCNEAAGGNTVHYWMPPRSSISKTGLIMMNSIGVIDKSYRGELIAALWNSTDKEVTVEKGQRLVQIVSPTMDSFSRVEVVNSLDTTERGEGGFGSTGQ